MRIALVVFSFCLSLLVLPSASFAQAPTQSDNAATSGTANQSPLDLNAAWLVTITGEDRTRTLRITGARPNGDGVYQLDALYGWTDGRQTPVHAEVTTTADERILRVTTQPGSKIATKQNSNGAFVGTFTSVNGIVKEITLQKSSEDTLAQAQQAPVVAINQPTANVPAACAAFIGRWKGAWPNNMTGRDGDPRWLWVTEIDEKCVAKSAYQYGPGSPRTLQSIEIKDGELVTACTKGTCTFKNRGGDLWVEYKGSDGWNTTVFRKVTEN